MNFKVFAVLAVLALAGSAAAARKRVNKKDVGPAFPSVADALIEGNYTQLVMAAELAGLVDTFGPDFVGTVFAPVDKAFASLVDEIPPALAPALVDPTTVAQVLSYHVLNTTLKAADLEDGAELETLAGVPLTVVLKNNKVYLEDVNGRLALVGKPDIEAGKAIVHAINKVLLPFELPAAGNATEIETPEGTETAPEGTETAPEGTVVPPTGAASGLMASAAAVAASLVAAAFLA